MYTINRKKKIDVIFHKGYRRIITQAMTVNIHQENEVRREAVQAEQAAQKKLELTKEQLAELRVQLEATVAELREAIRQWHAAHQQLAVQLA